jgi:putative redox protein
MADKKYIGSATAINKGDVYRTSLFTAAFKLIADEPVEYGGSETGPSPADYLCMALSSCKAITMRMYARRKGWPAESINVVARFVKGEPSAGSTPAFYCEVELTGQLTGEQRKRMLEIAGVCPIERLLEKSCTVITTGR